MCESGAEDNVEDAVQTRLTPLGCWRIRRDVNDYRLDVCESSEEDNVEDFLVTWGICKGLV